MSLNDLMAKLKAQYIEDLHKKELLLNELIKNNKIAELQDFFHKLKGSGATYGLPEVTAYGQKYEAKIKSHDITSSDLTESLIEYKKLLKK